MEDLEKMLDEKTLELKEVAITYEKQILEIRQNFEDSLETFKHNFKVQSGIDVQKENGELAPEGECDEIRKSGRN